MCYGLPNIDCHAHIPVQLRNPCLTRLVETLVSYIISHKGWKCNFILIIIFIANKNSDRLKKSLWYQFPLIECLLYMMAQLNSNAVICKHTENCMRFFFHYFYLYGIIVIHHDFISNGEIIMNSFAFTCQRFSLNRCCLIFLIVIKLCTSSTSTITLQLNIIFWNCCFKMFFWCVLMHFQCYFFSTLLQ